MKPWTSDKKWADGHDCLFTSIYFQGVTFGRCGHQPFSRPMSTLLFVMWLIVNLLLALVRVHQPVSRPMSTLLFCSVCGYQFVAYCPACPSAHFSSDVHVVALSYRWLSTCCLLAGVSISPFFCPMSTLLFCYVGGYQFVVFCPACPSAHFLSDVHEARLCDNRVVYGLLRIEHTTHAIQPSGEITSLKPSVQLS